MRFVETSLSGVWLLEPVPFEDDRGFVANIFSKAELSKRGCNGEVAESVVSYNKVAGTLRGMHYQAAPHAQSKMVRCTAGAVWDCAIDLRPGSPTFKEWYGVELTAANRRQSFIPEGFAHGYYVVSEWAEVIYKCTDVHVPEEERTLRWDDPDIGIGWPLGAGPPIVSAKDAQGLAFTAAPTFP